MFNLIKDKFKNKPKLDINIKPVCMVCGKENTEYYTFKVRVLNKFNLFPKLTKKFNKNVDNIKVDDVMICQTCISRAFRSFRKGV